MNNISAQFVKIIIAAVLLIHGLGHIGAIGALIAIDRGVDGGKWRSARSWLFPKLAPKVATMIAIIFWTLSLLGFLAAAFSFWGVIIPGELWRTLALIFAFISFFGITLFWGRWPMFNTLAAQAVNLAVIITQIWMHWPPLDMFGK